MLVIKHSWDIVFVSNVCKFGKDWTRFVEVREQTRFWTPFAVHRPLPAPGDHLTRPICCFQNERMIMQIVDKIFLWSKQNKFASNKKTVKDCPTYCLQPFTNLTDGPSSWRFMLGTILQKMNMRRIWRKNVWEKKRSKCYTSL